MNINKIINAESVESTRNLSIIAEMGESTEKIRCIIF